MAQILTNEDLATGGWPLTTNPEEALRDTHWPRHCIRQNPQHTITHPKTERRGANWNNLPTEILVKIISYLTFKELYQFSAGSTRMREVPSHTKTQGFETKLDSMKSQIFQTTIMELGEL